MAPKKELCPNCQTPIKTLKHSIICECGIKLKPIKSKYLKRHAI